MGETLFLHRVAYKLPVFSFTVTKKNIIELIKRKHYLIYIHSGNVLYVAIKIL